MGSPAPGKECKNLWTKVLDVCVNTCVTTPKTFSTDKIFLLPSAHAHSLPFDEIPDRLLGSACPSEALATMLLPRTPIRFLEPADLRGLPVLQVAQRVHQDQRDLRASVEMTDRRVLLDLQDLRVAVQAVQQDPPDRRDLLEPRELRVLQAVLKESLDRRGLQVDQ